MFTPDTARRRPQRGVTLVELLVGLVIGLTVITAAISTMLLSRSSAAVASDLAQLQQQASFALRLIGAHARQAGSIELASRPGLPVVSFDATFTGFGGKGAPVSGTEGVAGAPDTVSFSYQPPADMETRDCLGNTVGGERVDATFAVDKGNLRCQAASGSPQPLIGNVADFQVWYRVKVSPSTIRRMTADEVKAASLWGAVRSVEICLDLQGTESGIAQAPTYTDCNGGSAASKGLLHMLLRNVFDLRTQGA